MNEDFHRIFLTHSAVMLLIDPASGRIIESNKAAQRFYGYDAASLARMVISEINTMSPDAIEREMAAAAAEKRNHFIFQHRLADGSERTVEVHSSPVEIASGRLLFSIIHDITDRIKSEAARRESDSRYKTILEKAPVGIAVYDHQGTVTDCNDYLLRVLGTERDRVIGLNLPATLEDEMARLALSEMLSGRLGIFEGNYTSQTGRTKNRIRTIFVPYLDHTGKSAGGMSITENLDETKEIEKQFLTEREFSRRIIANMQDGFSLVDANGRQTEVNESFCRMTGFSREELIGVEAPNYPYWPPEEFENIQRAFARAMAGHVESFELIFKRKNEERFTVLISPSPVRDHQNTVVSYVATVKDITERKRAERHIHNLAFYDSLTQLPNRRLLLERLNQSQHTHSRRHNNGAILFIDVDHFKKINDTKGHPVGDALLLEIATRMKASVNVDDTVARWSGDEFVVLLNDLAADLVQAALETEAIAEKLRTRLNAPYLIHGMNLYSSVSIGICLFGGDDESADEILKRADTAMYQAKNSGRNSVHFFDAEMHAAMSVRISLESDMRSAVQKGQLQLFFQPQVNAENQITGAEALVRWLHPEKGMIYPGKFISLAEESDLILQIGNWVLREACNQQKAWKQDGLPCDLRVSVNVSMREFRQQNFAEKVLEIVRESGIEAKNLKLELTESVALTDVERSIEKMSILKAAGVTFSIDDFGTGFSSLAYLSRLPIDQIKIDQSFIQNIGTRATDGQIVQTIIGMAKNLGVEVMAEGVETDVQRNFLLAHGCALYQGYLYHRAMPAGEFARYVTTTAVPA